MHHWVYIRSPSELWPLLFSHLAQLLDEMTDLISFQIVLERVSLFHPLAAIS